MKGSEEEQIKAIITYPNSADRRSNIQHDPIDVENTLMIVRQCTCDRFHGKLPQKYVSSGENTWPELRAPQTAVLTFSGLLQTFQDLVSTKHVYNMPSLTPATMPKFTDNFGKETHALPEGILNLDQKKSALLNLAEA